MVGKLLEYIYERYILNVPRLDASKTLFFEIKRLLRSFSLFLFLWRPLGLSSLFFFDHLVFFFFLSFFLPPQKSLFIFKTGQGQLSIPTLE